MRYHRNSTKTSASYLGYVVSFLCLSGLSLALYAAPDAGPLTSHLAGTVLGTPETLGESDFRTEADFVNISDFSFLANGDMLVADSGQAKIFRIATDGIVRHFAGNGSVTSSGNGGLATEAGLPFITQLATSPTGSVYVAQGYLSTGTIRQISSDGVIRHVAGNGETGCPVAGSSATSAPLNDITAMVTDAEGTLYFFARDCKRIFRINSNGAIGIAGVANPSEAVTAIPEGLEHAWPTLAFEFNSVQDLAPDGRGGLWVINTSGGTGQLMHLTASGVVILAGRNTLPEAQEGSISDVDLRFLKTIAAGTDGSLHMGRDYPSILPNSLAEVGFLTKDGNYDVWANADGLNGTVPELAFSNMPLSPGRIRVSPDGSVYFRDNRSQSIFRIDESGQLQHFARVFRQKSQISTGGGNAVYSSLAPTNVVSDSVGNLYVGDVIEQKIYRIGVDGSFTHVAGNGSNGPVINGASPLDTGFNLAYQLLIDSLDRIYFFTQRSGWDARLVRFKVGGVIETILGGGNQSTIFEDGTPGTELLFQQDAVWTVAPSGEVYFTFRRASGIAVWKLATDGKVRHFLGTGGSSTAPTVDVPAAEVNIVGQIQRMAVDKAGTLVYSMGAAQRSYYVDMHGDVRYFSNPSQAFQNGASSLLSPGPLFILSSSWTVGGLIVDAGVPHTYLADYRIGGNVTELRSSITGRPRQDGMPLSADRLSYVRSATALPDGALAWVERNNNATVIRRSFPVPEGCTYSSAPQELAVGGGNNLTQATLTTGSNCPWTVGSTANWVEILSARTGKGPATIQLRTHANQSPSERTAYLHIAGNIIVVRQSASTSQNIFLISPRSAVVPPAGGTVNISVVASPQHPWQVSLPDGPLTLNTPAAGTGSGTISVAVGALPINSSGARYTLQVNNQPIVITQTAPTSAVPYTISSNLPNAKLYIDLKEQTLPYTSFWFPGSTHVLHASAFRPLTQDNLHQFLGWSDLASGATTRTIITPATVTNLATTSRSLFRVITRNASSSPAGMPPPVASRMTARVPDNYLSSNVPEGATAYWFPQGSTVQFLANNSLASRFVAFTGTESSTANPVAVTINGGKEVIANHGADNLPTQTFHTVPNASWTFRDDGRQTNPTQVAVTLATDGPSIRPQTFIAYPHITGMDAEVNPPAEDWLTVRLAESDAPLTAELNIDPAKANRKRGLATLYFHHPSAATTSATFGFEQLASFTGNDPWIGAVTDAGGFRQAMPSNMGTFTVAPGMILSIFGSNFAEQSGAASTVPLPLSLNGITVEYEGRIPDTWHPMPLFYVSPNQINVQAPNATDANFAQQARLNLRVRKAGTQSNYAPITIGSRVASLFAADSSGKGAPAGFYVRVRPDGQQERGDLFRCNQDGCVIAPAPLGGEDDELYLELFGTGFSNVGEEGDMKVYINGQAASIAYVGAHPTYVGLDQVNVKVPRDVLKGQPVDLYLWAGHGQGQWIPSNRLTLRFE